MSQPLNLELSIEGMHCSSCALLIDDALADLPGVLISTTSSKDNSSSVSHDHRATPELIIDAITELGYHARQR